MEPTSTNHTQLSIHTWSKTVWTRLVESKKSKNQNQFNELMMQAVPELNKYVASRLKIAIKKGGIPVNKYKVDDFVNDLFLVAYDEFSNFSSDKEFSNWLYIKIDQLIEDKVIDEDFDDFFFSDFANYSEKEWIELQQKVDEKDTTGDIDKHLSVDEVHRSNEKVLAEIFKSDADQRHLEQITNKLSKSEIAAHLDVVSYHLPSPEQSALHLIAIHLVDPKDVAFIKNKSEADIEKQVEQTKKHIKSSFASRYKNIVL